MSGRPNSQARDITELKKVQQKSLNGELAVDIIEAIPDGVVMVGMDGRVTFINKAFEKILGYNGNEIVGISAVGLPTYCKSKDKKRVRQALKMVIEKGSAEPIDMIALTKDGMEIPISFSASAIKDARGNPETLVAVIRDITERKKAEEALRESEKHYSALVGSLTDAVFKIKGRVITWCNDKVGEIYGYTKDELIGKKPLFLFPVDVKPLEFIGGVITTIEEQGYFHSLGKVKRKDGSMVDIEYSISRIPGSESAELVAVARDITERNRMEEELRLLSDAVKMTTDSVAITDMGGRILDINEAGLRMYGLSDRADFVGRNPLDAIAPEDRREALENMAELVETGHVEGIEYHVLRKDGSRILIETSVSVIKGGKGEPKGLVAVARDITERRRMEEALRESEKKYRQLFEIMQEGLWLIDKDSITTFVNPRMAEILGYKAEEMRGKHLFEFMDERGTEVAKYNLERFRQGIKEQHDFEFIRKDGARVYASLETSPITDEAENYVGALACVADITERKRAENERSRLAAELAEKNKELEQIVYVSSHDLRSPLVNVQGFSKELRYSLKELASNLQGESIPSEVQRKISNILESDIADALRYIEASVSKMDSLLAGLLRLSRLGRVALNFEELDMNQLLGEIVDAFEYAIKEARANVQVLNLPPCVGDHVQINQLFSNLIDNALKYLDAERPGGIEITGEHVGDQVVYCVKDNGIGIPKEHHLKIFEIFQRLNPSTATGEGLGLSIVKKILSRHNGNIWVESEPGVGSRFFVSLPSVSKH